MVAQVVDQLLSRVWVTQSRQMSSRIGQDLTGAGPDVGRGQPYRDAIHCRVEHPDSAARLAQLKVERRQAAEKDGAAEGSDGLVRVGTGELGQEGGGDAGALREGHEAVKGATGGDEGYQIMVNATRAFFVGII